MAHRLLFHDVSSGARVADTTATVDGETISIQLGAAASQVMTVTLKSWVPSSAVDMDATSAAGAANDGQDNFVVEIKLAPLQTQSSTGKTLLIRIRLQGSI